MSYKHVHYPDISNDRQVLLDRFATEVAKKDYKDSWVVTEKIHGMNFQVGYDGDHIYYGSRNQLLKDEEITPGQKEATASIVENLEKLWTLLAAKESLTVFGEYFGGNWPNIKGQGERVQRGVFYTPKNAFAVFDIKVDDNYMTYDTVNTVCHTYNLLKVPTLGFVNTLKEALEFPNNKPSVVYDLLAHDERTIFDIGPDFKQEENIMEGIVIRPTYADLWSGDHRVIIKSKNEKFREVAHEQRVKEVEELPEIVAKYHAIVEDYITENRLTNILSHYGVTPDIKQFGTVMKDFILDVLKEVKEDYPSMETELDKAGKSSVNKHVGKLASSLIRERLLA